MASDNNIQECFKILKSIKNGKIVEFDQALTILRNEVDTMGLTTKNIQFLVKYITKNHLRATYLVPIVKCIVPKVRIKSNFVETMIVYWLGQLETIPITVSMTIIHWLLGLWDYQLVDKRIINVYYDGYFYNMMKKSKLEPYFARLIHLLTKPDDVTRRQVNRLLQLQMKYTKPRKHINALLSLFKSYKPELVPEKIPSMNIESVWKPIPEELSVRFECARSRNRGRLSQHQEHFDWDNEKLRVKKTKEFLLPSVRYFHIGSTIYRDTDSKFVFDLADFEDIGKFHLNIELPCNATSLLANNAGYHFLTFADFEYQSRFSYNLYNSLHRALLFERDKFTKSQIEQLLNRTIEFCQYMQEGIPVVYRFLYDYFLTMSDDYRSKFLELLQWCTSISLMDLEGCVFEWIRELFLLSSLEEKCEIIQALRKLVVNLFVKRDFWTDSKKPSPFLGQVPPGDLIDIILAVTILINDLVTTGLTIHVYHPLFMYASLDFYEEVSRLETHNSIASWTIAPPSLIYGALITKSCAILSRACSLLLRYREMYLHISELDLRSNYEEQCGLVNTYGSDFAKALWMNYLFSGKNMGTFLKNLSVEAVQSLPGNDEYKDALFNIDKHAAILPYKYVLNKSGMRVKTQAVLLEVAKAFIPAVGEFIQEVDRY